MDIIVKNWDNIELEKRSVSSDIFSVPYRPDILHTVVKWQLAKRRSGCHKTKERNEIVGSTRKLFAQKGRGAARHGSIKAPIFRGGGTVFGPRVREHSYNLNKKIRLLGLKVALSFKLASGKLFIVRDINKVEPKTSLFFKRVSDSNIIGNISNISKKCLIIADDADILRRAISNISAFDILPVAGLNVLDIISHDYLLVSEDVLDELCARLL